MEAFFGFMLMNNFLYAFYLWMAIPLANRAINALLFKKVIIKEGNTLAEKMFLTSSFRNSFVTANVVFVVYWLVTYTYWYAVAS